MHSGAGCTSRARGKANAGSVVKYQSSGAIRKRLDPIMGAVCSALSCAVEAVIPRTPFGVHVAVFLLQAYSYAGRFGSLRVTL